MKFMGSKRVMLKNRLGDLIGRRAVSAKRFVDLFCGASSVSWFAASNTRCSVLASDLQAFAVVMANAVIAREAPLDYLRLSDTWLNRVEISRESSDYLDASKSLLDDKRHDLISLVSISRDLCKEESLVGPVWNAYGGYYFSPYQALTFDYMLANLPRDEPSRSVCLASIISSASNCAASPGHTAQPFRPTDSAGPFLRKAWSRDPLFYCVRALKSICPQYANATGKAVVGNALDIASTLSSDDLVFLDPPYSNVQYSRFYHVLETIVVGQCGNVEGAGRYPPISERPQSDFSKKSKSRYALEHLLNSLSEVGATVILTFPAGESSNGLSGEVVTDLAKKSYKKVRREVVSGKFSTLGGNNGLRASRQTINELLLLLQP